MDYNLPIGIWFSQLYSREFDSRCTAWPLIESGLCKRLDVLPERGILLSHQGIKTLRPGTISKNKMLVALDTPYDEAPPVPPELCFQLPPLVSSARDDGKLTTAEALIGGMQVLGFTEQVDVLARNSDSTSTFLKTNFGLLLPEMLPLKISKILNCVTRAVVEVFDGDHHSLMLMGSTLSDEVTTSHDIDLFWVLDGQKYEHFCLEDLMAYQQGNKDACFVRCYDPRLADLDKRLQIEFGSKNDCPDVTWEFAGEPYWGTLPGRQHVHLHFFGPMSLTAYEQYRAYCPVFAEHQRLTGRILAGHPLKNPHCKTYIKNENFISTLSLLRKRMEQASTGLTELKEIDENYQKDALILVKSFVGVATLLAAWRGCFTDNKQEAIDFILDEIEALEKFRDVWQTAYKLKVSETAFRASDLENINKQWHGVVKVVEDLLCNDGKQQ